MVGGVRWTAYGPAALEALRTAVGELKAGDALRPVAVVVPTNAVGVTARRALGRAPSGVVGVSLLSVRRLAELVGAPALAQAGRRPSSTPVLAAAARRVLAEEPGMFAPVSAHPATAAALVAAHRELVECDNDALGALVRAGERARTVVALHKRMRDELAQDWYEEVDLLASATAAVRAGVPVLEDLGAILLFLPQRLSRPEADLIAALAERVHLEVIAGTTGDARADEDVRRALRLLGADQAPPSLGPAVASEVVSVSDADEEVREAVRRIVQAARDGVPLHRVAVLFPTDEPYARLCHEHLLAAGVPFNGTAVRPLAERMLGRWILDLLSLRERGLRRHDVLDLLASAPIHGPDHTWIPVARWESISRAAGVVAGADWEQRLQHYAKKSRAEADEWAQEDDPPTARIARLRADADAADALRAFVAGLDTALREGATRSTWNDLVRWVRVTTNRYVGAPNRRGRWPEAERVAGDRVDAALDRILALDLVGERADLGRLHATLELELETDLGRVGQLGRGVHVGRLSGALGLDAELVVVLGCAEGTLPARVHEDSLLPDRERELTAGQLGLRAERVETQHRHLLAALAAAPGKAVLSYPRGDLRRSVERPASRWLLDTAEAHQSAAPPTMRRLLPTKADWLSHRASFAASLRTQGTTATAREELVRRLSRYRDHGGWIEHHPAAVVDAVLMAGLALRRARQSRAFTRYDGNLAGTAAAGLLPRPTDGVVSPTALEAFATCPHAYFIGRILRIEPVEDPEALLEITPLERGTVVHEVLEAWLAARLDAPPAPNVPWSHTAQDALLELAGKCADEAEAAGLTGQRIFWRRDRRRILRDLETFVVKDNERRRAHDVTPLSAELAFDDVTLPLSDGRSVRFRGSVDRLDRGADGHLLVTDYKTGKADSYLGLRDDPVMDGSRLQLPVYALAARQHVGDPRVAVRSEYWFTSARGAFRAIGFELTDEGSSASLSPSPRWSRPSRATSFLAALRSPGTAATTTAASATPTTLAQVNAGARGRASAATPRSRRTSHWWSRNDVAA